MTETDTLRTMRPADSRATDDEEAVAVARPLLDAIESLHPALCLWHPLDASSEKPERLAATTRVVAEEFAGIRTMPDPFYLAKVNDGPGILRIVAPFFGNMASHVSVTVRDAGDHLTVELANEQNKTDVPGTDAIRVELDLDESIVEACASIGRLDRRDQGRIAKILPMLLVDALAPILAAAPDAGRQRQAEAAAADQTPVLDAALVVAMDAIDGLGWRPSFGDLVPISTAFRDGRTEFVLSDSLVEATAAIRMPTVRDVAARLSPMPIRHVSAYSEQTGSDAMRRLKRGFTLHRAARRFTSYLPASPIERAALVRSLPQAQIDLIAAAIRSSRP